jgi:hypothetical protein
MSYRTAAAFALLSCILFTATATAQPGDRYLDVKARVLDILFPLDVAPKPYFLKMVLRFGDSETQLVVLVYPDDEKYWIRRSEVIDYKLRGMSKGELSQLISKMVAENRSVRAEDIAAKVKVDVSRSPVDPEALYHALDELKPVRISPILADRIAVDDVSEYEYWYDNWQESVHYTIAGPFKDGPQDQLVQWMIRFRANLPNLLKASVAPKP